MRSTIGCAATLMVCVAAQAGETCGTATPVTLGTNTFIAGIVTDNAPGATCGGFPSVGGENDAYFTFTPASTGLYTIGTCNTDPGFYDTIVSVYSGACGAPTQIGCADDSDCGTLGYSSRIADLALTGGTTYIIRVAAYNSASLGDGTGVLTITGGGGGGPANDLCANAQVVGVGSAFFDNSNASTEGPNAACAYLGSPGSRDIFFHFVAPAAGTYQIDTCGSAVLTDTILQVFGACGGVELACDDDSCPASLASRVAVPLAAGQSVTIRVSSWDAAASGTGVLNITGVTPPPAHDHCAGAVEVLLGTNSVDNTGGLTDGASCGNTQDTWYVYHHTGPAGNYTFSTCGGSSLDTVLAVFGSCGGSELGCNDQACASNQSALVVALGSPQTVYVRYGTWLETTPGENVLTIEPTVIPLSAADTYPGAQEMGTVLLEVPVTPGDPPSSTGISVVVDLSSIGGPGGQAFYDDGTNGDVLPGDNVFSFTHSLPISVVGGAYPLTASIGDDQARSATAAINLLITNGPSGACCNADVCTIARQTQCGPNGGMWLGVGSNCGGSGYWFAPDANTFQDIAGSGVLLAAVSGCDDCTELVSLPFVFTHMGNSYDSVRVSSNGNLQFGASNSAAFGNAPIPTADAPNDMLAPLWDDLNPGAQGDVYFLDDFAANARVIISWQHCTQYGVAVPDTNNFQVVLSSDGDVEFRYGVVTAINAPVFAGDDVTIGYENAEGAFGGQYAQASVGGGNTATSLTPSVLPGPCGTMCDSIDFNGDTLFPDTTDIDDFLSVFSGGPCSNDPDCGDIDFNNDGLFPDTRDIDALLSVFSGGACLA